MSGVGLASGAVAGMVAITPGRRVRHRRSRASLIGALAALASFGAVRLRPRLGLDDSLDVFAVHGVAATLGALLTGVLASTAVNAAGADGSLALVGKQAVGVVVTMLYSGGALVPPVQARGRHLAAPRRRAGRVGRARPVRGRRARVHHDGPRVLSRHRRRRVSPRRSALGTSACWTHAGVASPPRPPVRTARSARRGGPFFSAWRRRAKPARGARLVAAASGAFSASGGRCALGTQQLARPLRTPSRWPR